MARFRASRQDAAPTVDNGLWNPVKRENKRFDKVNKIIILKNNQGCSGRRFFFRRCFYLPDKRVFNFVAGLKKEVLDGGSTINCKSL
jgi:hypothetical protein